MKKVYSTERERRLVGLYEQGEATALQMLDADFNGFPPKGLDIVNPPRMNMSFRSVFSHPHFYVMTMNPFKISTLLTFGVLGLLKGAIAYSAIVAVRMASICGFVMPGVRPRTIHINPLWAFKRKTKNGAETLSNIQSHESKHVYQVYDGEESLSSAVLQDRHKVEAFLKEDESSRYNLYLAAEAEIQARLHTVIVNAYQQAGIMPTCKQTLIAALYSQGIDIPQKIITKMQSTMTGVQALEQYPRCHDFIEGYSDKRTVHNMNKLAKAIMPEHTEFFWTIIIPRIYGDSIEILGDRQGMKRMGHTHNIQMREIFYKNAKAHYDDVTNGKKAAKAMAKMRRITALMPKDDAKSLFNALAVGVAYQEYNATAISIPRHSDTFAESMKMLLDHPEMTRQDTREMLSYLSLVVKIKHRPSSAQPHPASPLIRGNGTRRRPFPSLRAPV